MATKKEKGAAPKVKPQAKAKPKKRATAKVKEKAEAVVSVEPKAKAPERKAKAKRQSSSPGTTAKKRDPAVMSGGKATPGAGAPKKAKKTKKAVKKPKSQKNTGFSSKTEGVSVFAQPEAPIADEQTPAPPRPPAVTRKVGDNRGKDDPNRPLSQQEWVLVWEYVKDFNQSAAVVRAGYKPEWAKSNTARIFRRPNVQAAIDEALVYRQKTCMGHADMVIGSLVAIVDSSLGDFVTWDERTIKLRKAEDIPPEKVRYLSHLETTPQGGVSIKLVDKMPALDKLMIHFGLKDRDGRAQKRLHAYAISKLQEVRDGKTTPSQAALDLEIAGLAVPETLRMMVAKQVVEEASDNDDSYSVTSEEEMAERAAKRRAQIENQRKEFVPQRQAEVQAIKDELGQGSFSPDGKTTEDK